MKNKIIFSFIILFSFLFHSCSDNSTNPTNSITTNDASSISLAKRTWFTSPTHYWDTYEVSPGGTEPYTTSKQNLYFSFRNYNFHFFWGRGTQADVMVDGSKCTTISWSIKHYSYYTNWHSFVHNGLNMKARMWIKAFEVYEYAVGRYVWHNEPRSSEVKIEDFTSPNSPSNFNITPTLHPSTSVNPKLTWSQTSDGDVTHVEIWRRNNVPSTSYSKIATISKSNTSYTDYSCNWNLPMGRTYWYKIRFKDATHNLYSSFTNEKSSSSL